MKTNTLIFGPIGSGKSFAVRTLLAEYPEIDNISKQPTGRILKGVGKKVGLLACEPGWRATNGDLTCEMGFHVREHLPANPDWKAKIDWLDRISNMSPEEIKKFHVPPAIKNEYMQFMGLFKHSARFVCQECKEDFGMVDGWSDEWAYVNDGLTGITKMAVHFTVGPKPTLTWPEIDAAQHHIEEYINTCVAIPASYILIAHWAREPRQVEGGGTTITINTVGQKLAGRLLLDTFDEVILAERDGTKYSWSTAADGVDQKARRLPYRAGIVPSFVEVFKE